MNSFSDKLNEIKKREAARSEADAISTLPLVGALAERLFVAVGCNVMRGSDTFGTMRSHTFAKRTANALNKHNPNSEGV